jgi:hypothetical protein
MKNICMTVVTLIAMVCFFKATISLSYGWISAFCFFAALTLAFMGIGEESKVWRRLNITQVCFFIAGAIFCGLRYVQAI